MRVYIQLLPFILSFYFSSWFYTRIRTGSVLITVNRILAKILFYIRSSNGISIVSIIWGLFAHFSWIYFLVLVFLYNATEPYMERFIKMWLLLWLSLGAIGETIESCINMKRAKVCSKKREYLMRIIILFFATGGMICLTIIYSLMICKLLL